MKAIQIEKKIKSHISCLFIIIFTLSLSSCDTKQKQEILFPLSKRSTDPVTIADEMEKVLNEDLMDLWYPRCIDTIYGGYLSGFDYEWSQKEKQNKFIVTQGRHTWACAQMAKMYPQNHNFEKYSKHGYKYLRDVMWDKEYGGYYTLTNREGDVLTSDPQMKIKIAYGNAFAIYGLAAYFEVSGDSSALDLAINSFWWLDKNAHDDMYGGYFQFLLRDGTVYTDGYEGTPPKDQNSSIHIIEALTELYKVWKDDQLKSRINEMLVIIRDTIATEKGYMNLFFRKDWSPVYYTDTTFHSTGDAHIFDHISFGHDIEIAYLLMEASEAIGLENDMLTYRKTKKMADHVMQNGWDPETGATFDRAYYFDAGQKNITILNNHTAWWSSTETVNTMLLMSRLYPEDPMDYYNKFTITWNYCKNYLIDWEHGGWYRVGLNEEPGAINADKGGIWKGNYHNGRTLLNCIKLLRSEE